MAAHKIAFRVYYEDTDAGGIVYHGRYLGFAERARCEALREAGFSVADFLHEDGLCFVVRHIAIRYRSPLRLDDRMEIETVLLEKGAAYLKLRQIFRNLSREGVVSALAEVELGCLRQADMKPARIPPECRVFLEKLAVE